MKEYIYHIKENNDVLNIEKFPIIYENSNYIYFKISRKNVLGYIEKHSYCCRYYESIKDINEKDFLSYINFYIKEEVPEDYINNLKRKITKQNLEKRIKQKEINIKNYEDLLEKEKKELEALKKCIN